MRATADLTVLHPPDTDLMTLTFSLPKALASQIADLSVLAGVTPENAMRVILAMAQVDSFTVHEALADLLEARAHKRQLRARKKVPTKKAPALKRKRALPTKAKAKRK